LRNHSDFRRGSSGPEDKKNSSEFFDMRDEVTLITVEECETPEQAFWRKLPAERVLSYSKEFLYN